MQRPVMHPPVTLSLPPLLPTGVMLLLLMLLGACQSRLPDGPLPDSAEQLTRWQLSARLGYRVADEGGSAGLLWQQRDKQGQVRLSGPVGFGSAELRWSPQGAELDTGKERWQASSSLELAARLTGLLLPMEALTFWVRGLAWPDAPATASDDSNGQLATLDQLGWQLTFSQYQLYQGLALPGRIRAERAGQRFTLVVKSWRPLP